uniref:Macaca fascicularis brain cDNA clone: QflA-21127, similar to human transmembrane protein 25 (TMEM25), mRNA, RefSeq: NM_032780.2 n=1 Tax=Macaca fascicularis TaxID=9541 RepID=I7GD28_MACFA|nr:unnamed protein product [Macaca fascicularis]
MSSTAPCRTPAVADQPTPLSSSMCNSSQRLPKSAPSTRKFRAQASWLSCLPLCVPTRLPMSPGSTRMGQ